MDTNARRKFIRSIMAAGVVSPLLARANDVRAAPAIGCSGPFFPACDYGVSGDGITDDTAALQAAIDAAGISGGIVLLPGGSFKVSSALIFANNGVELRGAGSRSSVLISAISGMTVVLIQNCLDVRITSLGIYSSTAWPSGRAIRCNNCSLIKIIDTYIENQFICLSTDSATVTVRDGYWGPSPAGTAVLLGETQASPESTEIHIDNLVVDWAFASTPSQSMYGLRIRHAAGVWVSNSDFIHSTYGLYIDPPPGKYCNFAFFSNCAWDSAANRCMYIAPSLGGFVSSLVFTNCWSASCTYDTCVVSGPVDGVQFVGHRFFNSTLGNGLWVHGSAKNVTVDSSFSSGNVNGWGYVFEANSRRFALRNSLSGTSGGPFLSTFPPNKYGAYVGPGSIDYIVTANMFKGNASLSLLDSGIGPKAVANNLL